MTNAAVDMVELAEDWLASKRPRVARQDGRTRSSASDAARRDDFCRWGRMFQQSRGVTPADAAYNLERDWGRVQVSWLTVEGVSRCLAAGEQQYSPATMRRMLATLRGFTKWATRRGHLSSDPCDDDEISLPLASQGLPRGLTPSQVEAILAMAHTAPEHHRGRWWALRDVAVVQFLAGCGLRRGEVAEAKVSWLDTDVESPVLRIVGKGGKARNVPVPRVALDAYELFYLERQSRGISYGAEAPLFCRTDGAAMTPSVVDGLVRQLALRAGVELPQGAASHGFRHRYATELVDRNVPLPFVSQLLGHADPRSSAHYARVSETHLVGLLHDAGML